MRRDLIELLEDRPIVHPTRIEQASLRGRILTLEISGYRWWASAYTDRAQQAAIQLVFERLGCGGLKTDEFDPEDDEALDRFEILRVEDTPWAQACDWSIYCSGPVGDPVALFVVAQDYLAKHHAFLPVGYFLNQGETVSRFKAVAASHGFLLARTPRQLRDLLCAELDRQHVPHSVLNTPTDEEPTLIVRLGESAFFCGEAWALIGEAG